MSKFTLVDTPLVGTLREHRPLLLAMEAIGWFHMAGKARVEFLRYYGGDRVDYHYEKWHNQESPPFSWDDLLSWVKNKYSGKVSGEAWPASFKYFTEKHTERNTGLLGLLQAAHGIVSGIEKNLPNATSEYLGQTLPYMWLASPWGYPKRNLWVHRPAILTDQGWRQLVAEITRILEKLRQLGMQGVTGVGIWHQWREMAIGPNSFIRRAFLSTLAETRLPNNDVTLWDQSYVAAALFKSAVAGALMNSQFQWKSTHIKSNTRWRLLTVGIGTEHYEARAVKIGDWTGARAAIDKFFQDVAELVEVDLAVGSLLYRDSAVAVFSFPGEQFDEEEQERQQRNNKDFRYDEEHFAPWLEGWTAWLQSEIDRFAQDLDLETPPLVRLSAPTRSLVPIVREQKDARRTIVIPIHREWNIRRTMPADTQGHVCPVCQIRLNSDPTSKTKPCTVCQERRHHRRNDWLQSRTGYDTIWFEEVADSNNRLALLTFSLDLDPWLNGERVDSLRAQAIPEWARSNPTLLEGDPNPIDPSEAYSSLFQYFKTCFPSFDNNDPVLRSLQEGYKNEKSWSSFFYKIVEDRADAPKCDSLTDDERAAWLAHQLFRKLPSPGRVYRFWREAEEFFEDLLKEFRQIVARSANPWRVRRLLLIPDEFTDKGWKDCALYNGHWRGAPLSLVYVRSLAGFVTVSNLARLLRPEEKKDALKEASVPLEEEDTSKTTTNVKVNDAREIGSYLSHLGVYCPIIPVELSPLRFRVLVPLEAASECVDLAVEWWKERFARVWDRSPLRAGVVAFPRTLPYQAVVEAARNVEEALAKEKQSNWWVETVEKRADVVSLYLRQEDRQLLRIVPITLPDGRGDVFYLYMEVEDQQLRYPRDFRHPDGRVFRHVADLRNGDGIKILPSTVMTLFMDSNAARFEVPASPRLLDEWEEMRSVWECLRLIAPSQTALQRLYSDLARLEQEWREPQSGETLASEDLRRDTYKALLTHHFETGGASMEYLTKAALRGWLTWSINWHLSTLKEGLERGA